MNDQELAAQISVLLWDEDLMGIGKGSGAPKDEFRIEAKMLVEALTRAEDEEDFTHKAIDIFNKQFEPTPAYDFDNTKEIAKKIYELANPS